MPQTASSALLKVQGSSKLAFGATTAALVALASGGTAVLVAHVAHSVTSPTALPGGALPPDASASPDGLVVDHPAGTSTPASQPADATERALHEALTASHSTPRRILTAPLVPLTPTVPTGPTTAPPAPPVSEPVSEPVTPPVSQPVTPPVTKPRKDPTAAKHEVTGQGKHPKGSTEVAALHAHGHDGHGRHARAHANGHANGKGRHAR